MEVDREYRGWKGDAAERWGQARDQDRGEIHPLKERLAVCLTALVSVLQSISVHTLTSSSLSAAAMTLIVTVWPKRWLLEGGGLLFSSCSFLLSFRCQPRLRGSRLVPGPDRDVCTYHTLHTMCEVCTMRCVEV